ncbi:hypothetical protein PaG_00024 [Moesziomyces aphidis]|uniref:Uncharacterized protein n=1 Tax=Moesziomyces aphidis TaxID=84754 RepID=W3VUY9_MOEAP|nr:hypothetical protein PaG_00024 [Moesziomyces aphidis]
MHTRLGRHPISAAATDNVKMAQGKAAAAQPLPASPITSPQSPQSIFFDRYDFDSHPLKRRISRPNILSLLPSFDAARHMHSTLLLNPVGETPRASRNRERKSSASNSNQKSSSRSLQ